MAKTYMDELNETFDEIYNDMIEWWKEINFIHNSKEELEFQFKDFYLQPKQLEDMKYKLNKEIEETRIHISFNNKDLWTI